MKNTENIIDNTYLSFFHSFHLSYLLCRIFHSFYLLLLLLFYFILNSIHSEIYNATKLSSNKNKNNEKNIMYMHMYKCKKLCVCFSKLYHTIDAFCVFLHSYNILPQGLKISCVFFVSYFLFFNLKKFRILFILINKSQLTTLVSNAQKYLKINRINRRVILKWEYLPNNHRNLLHMHMYVYYIASLSHAHSRYHTLAEKPSQKISQLRYTLIYSYTHLLIWRFSLLRRANKGTKHSINVPHSFVRFKPVYRVYASCGLAVAVTAVTAITAARRYLFYVVLTSISFWRRKTMVTKFL